MKRLWFLTALLLFACLLGACGQRPEAETESAEASPAEPPRPLLVGTVVDTDNVNLRLGPSAEARIIDNVRAGSLLAVKSEEPQDGWYQVALRGDWAYVYADFLYVSQWQSDDEVVIGTVRKDSDQVELRAAPSDTAEVVARAVRYQRFIVLREEVDEAWCQVDYKGEKAYLPLDSLELATLCIEDALL